MAVMVTSSLIASTLVAAAVIAVTLYAVRWEWRERQRIRAYRARLAGRLERTGEDAAWWDWMRSVDPDRQVAA